MQKKKENNSEPPVPASDENDSPPFAHGNEDVRATVFFI